MASIVAESATRVDWTQPSLWAAVAVIVGLPTAWNIVARNEHRTRTITKILGETCRIGTRDWEQDWEQIESWTLGELTPRKHCCLACAPPLRI